MKTRIALASLIITSVASLGVCAGPPADNAEQIVTHVAAQLHIMDCIYGVDM